MFDAESLELFNAHLASTHWDALYNSLSTNLDPCLGYDMFFDTYKVIFDKYFPVRSFKIANRMTPRQAWNTKGLMKSCVKKCKLYRKFCKNRTKANNDKYKAYRDRLRCLLRKAE